MAHRTKTIPLLLDCPDTVGDGGITLTQGIPFAPKELAAGTAVRIRDAAGRAYPTQAIPLATWDPEGRFVKWLVVDSVLPAEPADWRSGLELEYGDGVEVPPPDMSVSCSMDGAGIVLETGKLRLTLRKDQADFWGHTCVRTEGEWRNLVSTHPGPHLFMKDDRGTSYDSCTAAPVPTITVEDEGPIRASVCIKGYLADEDGRRFCPYVLRIHVFAGRSDIRLFHTLIFDQDPDMLGFSSIGMKMPFDLGQGLRAAFGGDDRSHWADTWTDAQLQQFSDQEYRVDLDQTTFAQGKRSSGWASLSGPRGSAAVVLRDVWQEYPKAIGVNQSGGMDIDLWPESYGRPLRFETPWKEPVIRGKYEEELREKLGDNPTAGVGFKGFLGTAKIDPNWAEGNQQSLEEARVFAREHLQNRSVIWGDGGTGRPAGLAKTHELWLDFGPPDLSDEQVSAWAGVAQSPPIAPPDPRHTCSTGVLRICHPEDRQAFPEVESGLEAMFDACFVDPVTECRLYGMIDYGDLVNGHGRPHGLVYRMFRDEPDFKFTDLVGWMNNESNDVCDNIWLLYARTGTRKYWRIAESYAEHLEDVDTTHAHPTNQYWVGLTHYHSMLHWSGGPSPSHTQIHGWLLHYYLTGNRRALDVCREAVDWALRNLEPAGHVSNRNGVLRREYSGPVSNLWAFYQTTWEEKYGAAARASLSFFLRSQLDSGSFPRDVFTGGTRGDEIRVEGAAGYSVGGCEHYSMYDALLLEKSPDLKAVVIGFADWVCETYYDPERYGITYGPGGKLQPGMTHGTYIHPLMNQGLPSFWIAHAYLLTRDKRYLGPLRELLEHFPAQARDCAAMTGRTPFQQAGLAAQVLAPAMAALAQSEDGGKDADA